MDHGHCHLRAVWRGGGLLMAPIENSVRFIYCIYWKVSMKEGFFEPVDEEFKQ